MGLYSEGVILAVFGWLRCSSLVYNASKLFPINSSVILIGDIRLITIFHQKMKNKKIK